MKEEKMNKKQIISVLVGLLVVFVIAVAASFSYYLVTGSNTTTTTAGRVTLEKAGTVSLTQGVSNIYLDVTAAQMSQANNGTDYYGMSTETVAATTAQNHVLATVQATGGETDTVYQCTMGYSMSVSQITNSSNSAYAALESEDAELVISTVPTTNTNNEATNIVGTYYLKDTNYLSETGTSRVIIYGNTSLQITGDLILHNLNKGQNDLAELGVNVSFQVTSFSCNPVEVIPTRTMLKMDRGTVGTLDAGDEITISAKRIVNGEIVTISGEDFYIINTDSTNTTLLAKNNLLVGWTLFTRYGSTSINHVYTEDDPGYGLQYSSLNDYEEFKYAKVPFSGTNYWDNSVCEWNNGSHTCTGTNGLKSEYATNGASYSGNPFPNVYNSNMASVAPSIASLEAENNGYTIAYYIEQYIEKLGVNGTGRLLTYEEKNSLPSTVSLSSTNSFWLGSAISRTTPMTSSTNLTPYYSSPTGEYGNLSAGVRPVIIIPTSSIQTS